MNEITYRCRLFIRRIANLLNRMMISFISFIIFLSLYEALSRLNVINRLLLSCPSEIFSTLFDKSFLANIAPHILASLFRIATAYLIGVFLGFCIGLLMGISRIINDVFKPFLLFQYIAPTALFPAMILLFGIGETSKILILAYSIFFPVLISTREGVKNVSKETIDAFKIMGASRLMIVKEIIIPAALPYVFVGMYISLIPAFVVLISAEMLGATNGLGYMILRYQRTFHVAQMFACIFLVMLMATFFAAIIRIFQKKYMHWMQR